MFVQYTMTVATVLSRCCYDCAPAEEIEVCHTIHIGLTQQLQPAVFTLTGLGSSFYQVHKSLTCFRFMKNNTRPVGVLLHVNQA